MSTPDALATQPGRGRRADSPTEIPMRGWKDVLWRIYADITENHILLTAAGVTFYLLLSLVPTLNAFISIYGLFNDRQSVLQHVELLAGVVPPEALSIIRDQLTRLTAASTDTLGVTLLVSLAIALWSASAGVKAMFEAMNVAYHEEERRSFLVLNAVALLFTLGGAIAATLVLSVVVLMPVLMGIFFPGGGGIEWLVRIGSYAALLVVLSLMLAVLYRWGPSREQAKWRWITPGVILSVLALGVGSVGFSWYVTNFTDNSATYGSLSAVIGLMTWMWISTTLVIVGAVLNSEIEHQTAKDSTTGEDKPRGSRGAFVADSVGETAGGPGDEDKAPKRERKRISWGTMAFALPAALALSAANQRSRRE